MRPWSAALPALLLLVGDAARAHAHTTENALVLLLPTGYYLAGGTLAVAISLGLVFLVPEATVERLASLRWRLGTFRPPSAMLCSGLAALILAVLLLAGFQGSSDPRANPLPVFVWSVWWGLWAYLQAACGDLWAWCNPLLAIDRLRQRAGRGDGVFLGYPPWLGYWPAVVFFLCFSWLELVHVTPNDPRQLATIIVIYLAVSVAGMTVFGTTAWLGRADPFSVFFRLVAHLSPFVAVQGRDGRVSLSLCVPGARLLDVAALPVSGLVFVLLGLAAISFDGLSGTFWWLERCGINPLEFPGRSAVLWQNTFGLAALWLALGAACLLAIRLGRAAAPDLWPREVAGLLVISIIPISLGYHFAHYLTVLLVQLQYVPAVLSDPFALGWHLVGGHPHAVTASFLSQYHSVRMLWSLQVAVVVGCHLVAVALAHAQTVRTFGSHRMAVLAQLPFSLLMVAYTLFGLWLLAAPRAA